MQVNDTFFRIGNFVGLLILGVTTSVAITSRSGLLGIHSYTVLTGSMRPSIPPGSIVFAQQKYQYIKGDVVTFGLNGTTVTHRIVTVKNGQFITRGDANNAPDTRPVLQKDIIGRVRLAIPYLGFLIQFTRTLQGFIGLIIAPALILVITEIISIRRTFTEISSTTHEKTAVPTTG